MSNTPSVTVHYAQAILQAAERLARDPASCEPAAAARREMWEHVRASFEGVHQVGEAWNALAPRLGPTD